MRRLYRTPVRPSRASRIPAVSWDLPAAPALGAGVRVKWDGAGLGGLRQSPVTHLRHDDPGGHGEGDRDHADHRVHRLERAIVGLVAPDVPYLGDPHVDGPQAERPNERRPGRDSPGHGTLTHGSTSTHRGNQRMPDITLDQFESEAKSFLDSNASLKAEEKKFVWGEGSDKVTLFDEKTLFNQREELAKAQDWRPKQFDAGFGWITGPPQYGGRELPQAYERALAARSRTSTRSPTQAPSASASAWSRRRSSPTPPTPRRTLPADAVAGRHRRRASSSASRVPARDLASCRRGPSVTARNGSSTGRRCGRRARSTATSARSSAAPTRHAEAQGSHRFHRRHARTGRRGASAAPDDRRRVVQRGVLHRRPRAATTTGSAT